MTHSQPVVETINIFKTHVPSIEKDILTPTAKHRVLAILVDHYILDHIQLLTARLQEPGDTISRRLHRAQLCLNALQNPARSDAQMLVRDSFSLMVLLSSAFTNQGLDQFLLMDRIFSAEIPGYIEKSAVELATHLTWVINDLGDGANVRRNNDIDYAELMLYLIPLLQNYQRLSSDAGSADQKQASLRLLRHIYGAAPLLADIPELKKTLYPFLLETADMKRENRAVLITPEEVQLYEQLFTALTPLLSKEMASQTALNPTMGDVELRPPYVFSVKAFQAMMLFVLHNAQYPEMAYEDRLTSRADVSPQRRQAWFDAMLKDPPLTGYRFFTKSALVEHHRRASRALAPRHDPIDAHRPLSANHTGTVWGLLQEQVYFLLASLPLLLWAVYPQFSLTEAPNELGFMVLSPLLSVLIMVFPPLRKHFKDIHKKVMNSPSNRALFALDQSKGSYRKYLSHWYTYLSFTTAFVSYAAYVVCIFGFQQEGVSPAIISLVIGQAAGLVLHLINWWAFRWRGVLGASSDPCQVPGSPNILDPLTNQLRKARVYLEHA